MRFLKSFIALMLLAIMISVTAQASDGTYYEATNHIYITGNAGVSYANNDVTLLMISKNVSVSNITPADIGYISQTKTSIDGSYSFNFIYPSNINDWKVYVKQANTDLTESVLSAVSISKLFNIDLALAENGDVAQGIVDIENIYSISDKKPVVVIAFYSSDNFLLGTKILSDVNINQTKESARTILTENIPDNCKTIKAYVWSDVEKCVPMANPKTKANEQAIVCWGDSLTAGAGGNGTTFPKILAAKSGKTVYNYGVGGESATTIASRQGGITMRVSPFTIPSGTTSTEISIMGSNGLPTEPLRQNNHGINPCYINGIKGELSYDKTAGKYYFTRSEAGEEVEVEQETDIVTNAMLTRRKDIAVIFVGTNGGHKSIDNLVNIQKSMINYLDYEDKEYVVLGLTTRTKAERQELEDRMVLEYGDRYINLREYLSTQGLADANITPTAEDLAEMEVGSVPPSLLADDVHFNAKGYELIGNYVYEKMVEIGILVDEE